MYAEIGMSLAGDNKKNVITIEDSSSGVLSSRLAGYGVIGFNDGNIVKSGLETFCIKMANNFEDVLKIIK